MKKITVIIIAILLVILAVKLKDSFSINIGSKNTGTSTTVNNSTSSNTVSGGSTQSGLETKESSEGPVTVAVTPLSLENSPSTWNFEIVLDTHSEELSQDLVAVSELVDDQGKSYNPISWEGDAPGGHHRSGILTFNPISPRSKSIELKIKNIGGTAKRSFKWDL